MFRHLLYRLLRATTGYFGCPRWRLVAVSGWRISYEIVRLQPTLPGNRALRRLASVDAAPEEYG